MPRLLSTNIFLFLLIIWTALGCKKNTPKPSGNISSSEQEECVDYVFDVGEIFETYITTGPQYTRPFFNPNNSDEFVYVRSGTSSFTELVKHKISTGEEHVLCNSIMIPSQPQWGRQGWILFNTVNNSIWKVREDGSQLTQIVANGFGNFTPVLNYAGDRFLGNKVFDLNGSIVDSIKVQQGTVLIGSPLGGDQDFKNGYYRFYDSSEPTNNFGYCKLSNNQFIEKLTSFSMGSGEAIAACKNNEDIFYARYKEGLYQLNINSHQVDKILDNCQSRFIMSLSISPDGKSIIYERVRGHQTTPGGMEIDEQSEIYLYNTLTKKEKKIIWEE
jgi:Tol biopolymer transport system component